MSGERPHLVKRKEPILADAFYTVRELTDSKSPHKVSSAATIFRAMANGHLISCRVGRKILFKGSMIHSWLMGKGQEATQ
jgi:hypothetical protein